MWLTQRKEERYKRREGWEKKEIKERWSSAHSVRQRNDAADTERDSRREDVPCG